MTIAINAIPASADVMKVYFHDSTDGKDKTYTYGIDKLHAIERGYDESKGKETVQLSWGDNYVSFYTYFLNMKSIEILKPEAVRFEIDFPPVLPLMSYNYNNDYDYSLDFNGRVYLDENADADIVRSGTLNIPTALSPTPTSSNIIKDDQSGFLHYQLGGEHGTEATFTVTVSTKTFADTYAQLIYNSSDAFTDIIHLYMSKYRWNVGIAQPTLPNYMAFSPNAGVTSYREFVTCWINNPYLVKHGCDLSLSVSAAYLNGAQIPASEINDYITTPTEENALEINSSKVNMNFPKIDDVPIDFNVSKFKPGDLFTFYLVPTVSLSPDAPEWLRKMASYTEKRYSYFSTRWTERDERPGRLHIINATFPDLEPTESSLRGLFDDNAGSFCHSAWTRSNERHAPYGSYIDIEFADPIESLGFAMQTRSTAHESVYPTKMALFYSTDGETWQQLATPDIKGTYTGTDWITEYADESNWFKAPEKFKYLRWCVIGNSKGISLPEQTASLNESTAYWNLAELHFYGK